tara:strand:- start:369 stop:809 length:441 start_codon:yes stop_codon:yes gene_type:complete
MDRKEYRKLYVNTYKGRKSHRISEWKYKGIIIENYSDYYDNIYMKCLKCEICKCDLCEEGHKWNSRNLDHDHKINNKPNIRNIVCRTCNLKSNRREKYVNNTSGYSNIIKRENKYQVRIGYNKKRIIKTFKSLGWAILFRNQILKR